jgi:hypothetical protein
MTIIRRVACVVLVGLSACQVRATEPAFFPIMAWDNPPNDPAVLKRMRECGITVAGFVPPSALDNCHAAGLKAIVSDIRLSDYDWENVDANAARTRVAEVVGEVRNHAAVFGYYLRDEPKTSYFPGLAKVAGIVKELHPGAWPYMNLFPIYCPPFALGAASYDEYVEQFIETCKPTILSYDNYSLMTGTELRPGYFANLEAMRRAARKHNLPFWNIVLASAHFNYREVTQADFRFQAYTSLAYGARGLAYFKYFTPAVGNYRNGPIDQFGNQTPTWYSMQSVNLQIAMLADTLLKLRSDRVYHFGEIPEGCAGPDDESLIKSARGPMLVGDFTHEDGSRYVMIVNKNLTASITPQPEFRAPVATLHFISPYNGTLGEFTGEQIWLAPGQGVLLKPSNP